jgi:hypothetical protein
MDPGNAIENRGNDARPRSHKEQLAAKKKEAKKTSDYGKQKGKTAEELGDDGKKKGKKGDKRSRRWRARH